MGIREKVNEVKETLKDYPNVKIIAATKYLNIDQTNELLHGGIINLGENRVDMFLEKYEALKDYWLGIDCETIHWHFFGVVQSRKVKDIANKITCLHSLDRMSLALELDKKLINPLDCFIQVNISDEPNKTGIAANKVKAFVKQLEVCKKIRIVGLMCIAKMTADEEVIRESFQKMKKIKEEIEGLNLDYAPCHELSMGMSNDYLIALEYGATSIRLGRIFLS